MTDFELAAIESADWYISLTDNIHAIRVERSFNAAQEVLKGYHEIGELLVNDAEYQKHSKGNGLLLSRVSNNTGVSERNLYRSMQFYREYPDFEALPFGKNFTWHKYCNGLLDDGKDKPSVSLKVRISNFSNALELALKEYPGSRDEIIREIWRVIGREWKTRT